MVRYRLAMSEPHTHLLEVEVRLGAVGGPVELVMPVWTPGSYLIREFARNVQDFTAHSESGDSLPWQKLDKHTWRVDPAADGDMLVRYRVLAHELTVRTSHVDASHAHVNGASVFMCVRGREDETLQLEVCAPDGWRISTPMDQLSPTLFEAASFDELVDSPLEIGTHELLEWEQHGVPHAFAIWGRAHHPHDRLVEDTRRIVDTAATMFGGLPYPRYLFILHLVPSGRGGLEHAASTVLQMNRDSFHGEGYESLLALIAHEFFHVWNAKRIRPETLGPFDYTAENYTRNLWVVEGFTTYYTDLLLVRAGLMKPERYLERLAEAIARHETLPGRHHQTLEESSFDTWIRFYRPDSHSPNAQISYYHKGALVALLLDMEIRRASDNQRSLDDLMRLLWERYGTHDVGFPEEPESGIRALAEEVYGGSLEEFFRRYVTGVEELQIDAALAVAGMVRAERDAPAGVGWDATAAGGGQQSAKGAASGQASAGREASMTTAASGETSAGGDFGSRQVAPAKSKDAALLEARLGVRVTPSGGAVKVSNVLQGTSGQTAGINAGDEIVALNGLRVSAAELPGRLRHLEPGTNVTVALFRREELLSLEVKLGPHPPRRLRFVTAPDATEQQRAIAAHWLRLTEVS